MGDNVSKEAFKVLETRFDETQKAHDELQIYLSKSEHVQNELIERFDAQNKTLSDVLHGLEEMCRVQAQSIAKERELARSSNEWLDQWWETRYSQLTKEKEELQEEVKEKLQKKDELLEALQAALKTKDDKIQSLDADLQALKVELNTKDEKIAELQQNLTGLMIRPTADEMRRAMASLGYEPNCINIAVAGESGAGKSSFINAVRGLVNTDFEAAKTGFNETTLEITKYLTSIAGAKLAIFDIPGAGSMEISRLNYFKDQGLYIMNALVIIWSDRLTDTALEMMKSCLQLNVPFFLVRTKCDCQIFDKLMEKGCEYFPFDNNASDDEMNFQLHSWKEELRKGTIEAAKTYIDKAHQDLKMPLPTWNYLSHIYLVNKRSLCLWSTKKRKDLCTIDEEALIIALSTGILHGSGKSF